MVDATLAMLERWEGIAQRGEVLDISQEMRHLVLRISGQTLFTIDFSQKENTVGQAFLTALSIMGEYMYLPFPPLFVPTSRNLRLKSALHTLDRVVQHIIDTRRKASREQNDLLSMLLAAHDEGAEQGMSDRQLRDEIVTLLLAGHETTANALAWAWCEIGRHPEVEGRMLREIDDVLAGNLPTIEHLERLSYTRMVIEETLRLYPALAAIPRRAIAHDSIAGYHIPANSIMLVSPWVTHRHPAFWEEPHSFDPERFDGKRSVNRPPYAYFPFGAGPHLCIGKDFAMMEMQLVLATISQRYRLNLLSGQRFEPYMAATIHPPKDGVRVTLERR